MAHPFPTRILFYFLFFLCTAAYTQSKIKLDNVISFDELIKRKVERNVSWTNPDGTKETMRLMEMAIPFTEEAKQLTLEFNTANYGLPSYWLTPKMIVLHSMDLGNLQRSLEQSSLLHDHLPESWSMLYKAGKVPNGVHFMVDKNGTIYCLAPPVSKDEKSVDYTSPSHRWYIKRHQDGNPCAIGIENVTEANGDFTDLTAAQVAANAQLVRWLIQFENNNIKYVSSHHQFNNEATLNQMHFRLKLSYQQKAYRTTGRKDIGEVKLNSIISKIKEHGYVVHSDFNE